MKWDPTTDQKYYLSILLDLGSEFPYRKLEVKKKTLILQAALLPALMFKVKKQILYIIIY